MEIGGTMATRLLLNGAEFQVNIDSGGGNGISGNQSVPDAAAGLGSFVIGYQSDFNGSASDQQAIVRGYRIPSPTPTYSRLRSFRASRPCRHLGSRSPTSASQTALSTRAPTTSNTFGQCRSAAPWAPQSPSAISIAERALTHCRT